MDEIDLRILNHIGRYTVTLRRVLQVLFFDGGSAETALKRLERGGYILRVERQLPGNFSYYQLKKRGAAVINVSENKANPKELKGLAQDLAALWFSCMGDRPRKRLGEALAGAASRFRKRRRPESAFRRALVPACLMVFPSAAGASELVTGCCCTANVVDNARRARPFQPADRSRMAGGSHRSIRACLA